MSSERLQDLSLEKLWQLFPITLVPHDSLWKEWANDEITVLYKLLGSLQPTINHIGSTAIPDIKTKPIVDILIELDSYSNFPELKLILEKNGYICMSENENRISFNKGYTSAGYAERVFHIHVHLDGDNDEIIFRDYLITHPEAAREYENLKLSLLSKYRNHRDNYTNAKTPFIKSILRARSKY